MKPKIRRLSVLIIAATLSTSVTAAAQKSVFVIRHAERADGGATGVTLTDPDISEAGRVRAQSLASALKDTGITAIYVTEFKRTQQTAAATAAALGIQPIVLPQNDTAALVEKLKGATGNVLVIGHSNTVPEILKGLGIADPVKIGDADFDNLFIVTQGNPASLLRLHYR